MRVATKLKSAEKQGMEPVVTTLLDWFVIERHCREEHETLERCARYTKEIDASLISQAMHGAYSPAEVQGWLDRAETMIGKPPAVARSWLYELIDYKKVPTAPLREAYEERRDKTNIRDKVRSLLEAMEEQDGADYESKKLNGSAVPLVERVLGLKTNGDPPSVRLFIPYEWAVAFAQVLGLDPYRAGV